MQIQPKIIWVVGPKTNIGKTTISYALIRALEGLNRRAIGFKPFVGGRFRDLIDFLSKFETQQYIMVR